LTTDKTNRMLNVFNRRCLAWHTGSVMEGPYDKWRTPTTGRRWWLSV